jgi:fumarate hydratase class II
MVVRLGELSGLRLLESDDLFESMQSLADVADFSASMRNLALTLIRIANDLRLLASGPSTGLDEIRLPAVQPGSSIMPGKVNPVMAEMLDQAMFHIIGCDTTIALAVQAGQLELNVMMPVIAHNLFEMMQVLIGALNAFTERAVKGLRNREKAEVVARNAIHHRAEPAHRLLAGRCPRQRSVVAQRVHSRSRRPEGQGGVFAPSGRRPNRLS